MREHGRWYTLGRGPPTTNCEAMASGYRSQWRKPSLLRKFVKSKTKRGSKVSRRRSATFNVAIPSAQADILDHDAESDAGQDSVDMDGGALSDPDVDSDAQPKRCRDTINFIM